MMHLVAWVFISCGVLLVAASVGLENAGFSFWAETFKNLGLVSISVMLVHFLWNFLGGDPIQKQVDALAEKLDDLSSTVDIVGASKAAGLEGIYDRQGNFGAQSDWESILRDSDGHVDVMGRTLFGWTRSQELEEIVLRKISEDEIRFRWLLMSPKNKYLELLEEEKVHIGPMLKGKIDEVLSRLLEIKKKIPDEQKHLFLVQTFDHVPLYCSVVKAGTSCYVTPYLCSSDSDGSPMFRVGKSDCAWGITYRKEFDAIWSESSAVRE